MVPTLQLGLVVRRQWWLCCAQTTFGVKQSSATKAMKIRSATALLLGILLIGSSFVLDRASLGALLQRRAVPSEEVQRAARQIHPQDSCFTCVIEVLIVREVEVVAPREIRIDQSAAIRVGYSEHRASGREEEAPGTNRGVSTAFSITLSGANFEVKPAETQRIAAETEVPAGLAWTIKPKGTGNHVVTLDFVEMPGRSAAVIRNEADGRAESVSKTSIVEIPIDVLSEWSVSPWVVSLVKAAFSLVGFVFVTPGVWWLFCQIRSWRSRGKPFPPLPPD